MLTENIWWKTLKNRLLLLYLLLSIALLTIGALGQIRLLNEVGRPFGGFIWGLNADGRFVVVSVLANQSDFASVFPSLITMKTIESVNGQDPASLPTIYRRATPGQIISYTFNINDQSSTIHSPVVMFTSEMWLQNYGLAFLAGFCWLLIGGIVLATARGWTGAIEGLTMLPASMVFLLYSHWGNVQNGYPMDSVLQLLWLPAFALLGAAFLHLILNYLPDTVNVGRLPRWQLDLTPYLFLIALEAFNIGLFFLRGSVPTTIELWLDLGYGLLCGLIGVGLGIVSLIRIGLSHVRAGDALRKQLSDLLRLLLGGVFISLGLGSRPLLLTGEPFLAFPVVCVLSALYPLVLLYAIRSLRLIGQVEENIVHNEEILRQSQRTVEDLQRANSEQQRATSLLLYADAHLRSLLSERIHDQPRQQALRIRSLLGHWQHKLKVEIEHDLSLQEFTQPIVEALGKVRKISEDLESDLRGLQLLVEDTYQRRSLGLKLHLEKLVREDLPALHPESPLRIQADLWALDTLDQDLEQTSEGEKFAEAVSYMITQALLNVYNHAGASFATVRAVRTNGSLEISIIDDGRGFDVTDVSPEKTSMFKAEMKAREAGGTLLIRSTPRPLAQHGTVIILKLPFPEKEEQPADQNFQENHLPEQRHMGRNSA